ncbi:hypothetical protein EcWSU1_01142 [Enterobacter ludwigii]|uniref:Uncharacterized protein n=1 Tax=Enterobacter ludwigii TaxID=299767 RepID=G8LDJ4_9ENTR|nr:hypothetical protein EcWSU1_01142 [Enterobacter ludwigii]
MEPELSVKRKRDKRKKYTGKVMEYPASKHLSMYLRR